MKIQQKKYYYFFFWGGGSGGQVVGVRVDVSGEVKFCENSKKKKMRGGGLGREGGRGRRVPVNSYSSQFVLKSIRTHFGQFVLKILVNSYSFGQFVLMSGQFVLILVNSYSFWSIRTQTQMSTN